MNAGEIDYKLTQSLDAVNLALKEIKRIDDFLGCVVQHLVQ